MKRQGELMVLFLILAGFSSITGCSTTERRAYETLAVTQETVDLATATFRVLNANGEITQAEYDKVSAVYEDYQAAMNVAIDLAQNDLSQITPERAFLVAVQLIDLIETLEK